MGFAVDMFYDSLGIHAFACVLIMYLRNYWLKNLTPQGGYRQQRYTVIGAQRSSMVYGVCHADGIAHHSALFFTEAGGFGMFWFTLWKIISSTLFTLPGNFNCTVLVSKPPGSLALSCF
jgi:hypothetical protein